MRKTWAEESRGKQRHAAFMGLGFFKACEEKFGYAAAKALLSPDTAITAELAIYMKEKEKK